MNYDIVLRNAHVIDPSQSIDGVCDVCIRGGRIESIAAQVEAPAAVPVDLTGKYLSPGLVDLHGHWYEGSAFGIDPARCLADGVTTVVDAGTSGFINFREFRAHRIDRSSIRILAFLNIAAAGIPTPLTGELENLRMARPMETAAMIQEHPDVLLGVKIRIGAMSANNGEQALERAIQAAESAACPVMIHISRGAQTPRILKRLRPGDILTHCFQGRGDGLFDNGAILPEALAARNNGVVFDVGHGCGSFSWEVARRAFEHSFYPDTISSDLHRLSVERFSLDLPSTMSKFLHLGMPLYDVILKTTIAPARAMGRAELGTLAPGAAADLFVFSLEEGEFPLEDTHMVKQTVRRRIHPERVMKAGHWVEAASPALRPLEPCDYEILHDLEDSAGHKQP
ncbi:MAG TPA: amidohydrolase/deacetylase family metallohydrolase [Bryobacteraceae bacterium]|nr:amidohydrolase/deacetylase family metallohydrolase [Bryobacteraceae bacterium]